MKYTMTFGIECGKKTCAVKPGKFCQFFNLSPDGKDVYEDENGWLQRHPDCLSKMNKKEIAEYENPDEEPEEI